MNLYKRTAAGNSAALNPRSPLSRSLRALLIRVDGRTGQQTYIRNMASLGDVAALLDSLLTQGYVEIVQTDNDEFSSVPSLTDWQDTATLPLDRQSLKGATTAPFESALKLSGLRSADVPSAEARRLDSFQLKPRSQGSAAWQTTTFAPPIAATRLSAPLNPAQYQLRNAISLMSDFVTTHLPAESIEIVLTLEGLNSVAQVVAKLNDYTAMIAPAGATVTPHLNELRALLSHR